MPTSPIRSLETSKIVFKFYAFASHFKEWGIIVSLNSREMYISSFQVETVPQINSFQYSAT